MFSNRAKKWMRGRGKLGRNISSTARDVGVTPRCAFGWLHGSKIPRLKDAAALIVLAATEGVQLDYSDIYGTPRDVLKASQTTTTTEERTTP